MTLNFGHKQPDTPSLDAARTLGATFAHTCDPADGITICGVTLHGSVTGGAVMVGQNYLAGAEDLRRLAAFLLGAAETIEIMAGEQRQQKAAPLNTHESVLRQQGFAIGRGSLGGDATTQERDA